MKKYFKLIIIVGFVLLFSACGKKVENNLVIKDVKTGYTTTFTIPKSQLYTVTDTSTEGAYVEVEFENKEKNLEFEVYYFKTNNTSFETGKQNRINSMGYKEFVWNGYKGYIYNADNYSLDFNILLKEDESNGVGLFGSVEAINSKTANVVEDFNSNEIQEFMNSVKFSEEK